VNFNRTTALAAATIACVSLPFVSLADAQVTTRVQATQVAGFGLPPGQTFAPSTPGGAVVAGSQFWSGDGTEGFLHWLPADPNNPDPIDTGILVPDQTVNKSIGGGTECFIFCHVGQIAYDGNQTAYIAVYDHATGQPFSIRSPGINRITLDGVNGFATFDGQLVPNAGLAGNLTTAVALGPDGNLYVGFLKNGNIVRIVNPSIPPGPTQIAQSFGGAPNGRPIRSLAFVGNDLWVASSDGLSVARNAPACTGNRGGCGNAVAVADGFPGLDHVGLTTDGIDKLYVSVSGRGVFRRTISTGVMATVATGGLDPTRTFQTFAFVGGHTNLLMLDRLGNLWIGDDTSDGIFNFTGRIWRISSGALSSIP
jgi:hypothetical protein